MKEKKKWGRAAAGILDACIPEKRLREERSASSSRVQGVRRFTYLWTSWLPEARVRLAHTYGCRTRHYERVRCTVDRRGRLGGSPLLSFLFSPPRHSSLITPLLCSAPLPSPHHLLVGSSCLSVSARTSPSRRNCRWIRKIEQADDDVRSRPKLQGT